MTFLLWCLRCRYRTLHRCLPDVPAVRGLVYRCLACGNSAEHTRREALCGVVTP
jgi:hypothetical protein